MARKRTVKVKVGPHELELRMNFARLAAIEEETGVNLLSNTGASEMMRPTVLPKALSIMAGGKPEPSTLADDMDVADLQDISEAITKLLAPDPS